MKNSTESSMQQRAAGILCHISSLPGPEGVGTLGAGAHSFIDQIAACGLSLWQILPLNPPVGGNSPYSSWSAFAANPVFIDLRELVRDDLLLPEEVQHQPRSQPGRVDFAAAWQHKALLLAKAAARLLSDEKEHPLRGSFELFCKSHRDWLDDAALFGAIAERTGTFEWWKWPDELRSRGQGPLKKVRAQLSGALERHQELHKALQFLFDRQWSALRDHAKERGVIIIGDMPLYVSRSCADVWARPDLFDLDGQLRPRRVSGVPPDDFSATGQLWGHPLYNWGACKKEGYAWWIARLRRALELTQVVRLDHFRGLSDYWAVPQGSETAATGKWEPGPGAAFLQSVGEALGRLPFIAEDLGDIDEEVLALRDQFCLPGMAVLQFGFGGGADSIHLPHNHVRNQVVYPGTHDNDTLHGWLHSLDENTRIHVKEYFGASGSSPETARRVLCAALSSVASWAVVPLQDWLGLGSDARLNRPGSVGADNWSWRFDRPKLGPHLCETIRRLLDLYGRRPLL